LGVRVKGDGNHLEDGSEDLRITDFGD
jgi:hypothetical protein